MKLPRAITLFILSLVMLLIPGCGRQTTEDFNRLRIQLLTDAFRAVHDQKHDLAIARLAKLEESPCVNDLIKREHQNITIGEVSGMLAKGDLVGAELALNKGVVRTGSTIQMNHAKDQVAGLRQIKEYLHLLPFDEAENAAEEVARLPNPTVFDKNARYGKWLAEQHRMLQQLIRTERLRVTAEILDELDVALVKGDSRAQALLAQLIALDPKHPLAAAVSAKPEAIKGMDVKVFDLICFIQARYRGTARHAQVMALYGKREPASFCGEYLKADAEMTGGNIAGALARLRSVDSVVGGLDASRLRVPLNRQINRISATATPSLPSILETLYQLQLPTVEKKP